MLIVADVVTGVAVVLVGVLVVLIGWAVKVGNFYWPTTPDRVQQVLDVEPEPLLYHYMSVRDFDRAVDLTTGTAEWQRGNHTLNFYFLRGIYFYAGHGPTGARSNHSRKRRRDGAVVALELQPLLDATAHVRLWFRRWDKALAVRADYTGPIIGYRRGIDILTTKTNPSPPDLIPVELTGTPLSSKGTP